MSRGVHLNKAALIGTISNGPCLRTKKDGCLVTNIALITTERYFNKITKEKKEFEEWHDIVLFDPSLEKTIVHFTKGRRLYVEGSIQTSTWINKRTGKKQQKKLSFAIY